MTTHQKKKQPASPKNSETHQQGQPLSLNVAATVAEVVGVVDMEDAVNMVEREDTVDMVDTVEAVDLETTTKVCTPIAKLTARLRMHAKSSNALGSEETRIGVFVPSGASQETSKLIGYPTNIYKSLGNLGKQQLQQL
jgi:hypothetical protein